MIGGVKFEVHILDITANQSIKHIFDQLIFYLTILVFYIQIHAEFARI